MSRVLSLFLCATLFVSCSKDNLDSQSQSKNSNFTVINPDELYGRWNISEMVSSPEVDLNGDTVHNQNLLAETDCFNSMYIIFDKDNTFETNNARMTFEGGTGDSFECRSPRVDYGKWTVSNDTLLLTMNVDDMEYTHAKKLILGSNTFAFDVAKLESDQYVEDPGDTDASSITILELEYTKAN